MTHTDVPADRDSVAQSMDQHVATMQSAWKEEAKGLGKLATAFGALAKSKTYQDLSKLPGLLDKVETKIQALAFADRGAAVLEEIRGDLQERLRRMQENLGRDLPAACEARGLEFRVVRREDPVEVRIPPFAVQIDRKAGRAELRFGRQAVASCNAEPDTIVNTHDKALQAMRKGFRAETFFEACREAWCAARGAGCSGAGDRVEILDFLPYLALQMQSKAFRVDPTERNFRSYSRARFAFDVMRLRREAGLSSNGWRMNLGVATGTTAAKKNRALFFEDEHGDGEFKLTVFFTPIEVRR